MIVKDDDSLVVDDESNKEEKGDRAVDILYIVIETQPTKTTYLVGEYFDPTGMVVRVYYRNGTNNTTSFYTYSPTTALTTSVSSITVSFLGKSANQPITVVSGPYLAITVPPNKTSYKAGDFFEPYGMIVRLYNADGTSQIINNYSFAPIGQLTTSNTQITVSYSGYTANQSITVADPSSNGYFIDGYLGNGLLGNNPYVNLIDLSFSHNANIASFERDSFKLDLELIYRSNMPDVLSIKCSGLPKRFKTNYHQFVFVDGLDANSNPIVKYVDSSGYIHAFSFVADSFYHDTDGEGLIFNAVNATIIDELGNVLSFDLNNNGRLISVQSGLDSSNLKVITYSSSGIDEIYDNRSPNNRFKFSYDSSLLKYIYAYYDGQIIKAYTFFYDNSNRLSYLTETVGNQTRTLFNYSYNSFDRVNQIKDVMSDNVFRFEYSWSYIFNDYIFGLFKIGYINNNNVFVANDSYHLNGFEFTDNINKKVSRETVVANDNDINVSYSFDSGYQPVSALQKEDNSYFSLSKHLGKRLDFEGSTGDLVNQLHSFVVVGSESIYPGLASSDLDADKNIKLSVYIKLRSQCQRAVLTLSSSGFATTTFDINPKAYMVWQLVEIPLLRSLSNGNPIAFSDFDIEIKNESNQLLTYDVADFTFAKSSPFEKLYFYNGGSSPICFDDIAYFKLYTSAYSYVTVSNSSTTYMTEVDLIRTLVDFRRNVYTDSFAYFDGGKVVKRFVNRIVGVTSNNIEIDFLNYNNLDNSVIPSNTNWFFAASVDALIKTYYRFQDNYYETLVRTEVTNNNQTTYLEEISRCNYKDQLIYSKNKQDVLTYYYYFSTGELRKKQIDYYESGVLNSVVLYEAELDTNNKRIVRVNKEKESSDYQYNGYQLSKKTINLLDQNAPYNSLFSQEYSYDGYLGDVNEISFLYSSTIEEKHTFNYQPNIRQADVDDIATKYRLSVSQDHRTKTAQIYNGSNYIEILSIEQTNYEKTLNYNNSFNNVSTYVDILVTYDGYNRIESIEVNGNTMTLFYYEDNSESPYASNITQINDCYNQRTVYFTYDDETDELLSVTIGSFSVQYGKEDSYSKTNIQFANSETYSIKENETEIKTFKGNTELKAFSRTYTFDKLSRLSTKKRVISNNNVSETYSYLSECPSLVSAYNYDNGVYQESYSYNATLKQLSSVSISASNFSSSVSYQYDGFNRLTYESNSKLGITRAYAYESTPNSSYLGRMVQFGNNIMTYDSCGRLASFGNNTYQYDTYGNRRTKNQTISYQWIRGHLLSSVDSSSFAYDYRGYRISKQDSSGNTHTYHYNGDKLVGEDITDASSDTIKIRYFYDKDGPSGFRMNVNNLVTFDYMYIRNAFNDIVGITQGNTLQAFYVYDAWGNHKIYNPDGTEASSSSIGNLNPFRYRSYYYDTDTGLYYLMSRYYDSEIGQFISPDEVSYLEYNKITGFNLYAYCQCNPVNNRDPDGYAPIFTWIGYILGILNYPFLNQIGVTVFSYLGALIDSAFDQEIKKGMDAVKWNPFNYDNQLAFDAIKSGAKVTFYMGAPVLSSTIGRSGSFGAIFFDVDETEANMLNHEFGHIIQMMILGTSKYLTNVFIPSALQIGVNGDETNYYFKPWEASASILGGDWNRNYSAGDYIVSFIFLQEAKCLPFPFIFLFGFWG